MSSLTDVRLNILDPYGVLYFETVGALPEPLVPQTAYIINGVYYVDGLQTNLKISDSKILSLLAVGGATVDSVSLQCLKICRASLKIELAVKKSASGAESDEYQSVKELYDLYTAEIADYEKKTVTKSSRYQCFSDPEWLGDY